jgi:carboxymethylenebutenolidase
MTPLARLLMVVVLACAAAPARAAAPETVHFASADGRTQLTGYLFLPAGKGPHPAIVMLHGRGGSYSSKVKTGCTQVGAGIASPCDAAALSQRHVLWGRFWAERGYVALHVDSFGPRGKAHGFGRHTHDDPQREDVNERSVRPLDARGALAWLKTRSDVRPDRIGVQGWSNGGSTVLNAVAEPGFAAALALYPGCGRAAVVARSFSTPTPLLAMVGSADEEVSPAVCRKLLEGRSNVEFVWYDGATHGFDDPAAGRRLPANREATTDAMKRAEAFAARWLPAR